MTFIYMCSGWIYISTAGECSIVAVLLLYNSSTLVVELNIVVLRQLYWGRCCATMQSAPVGWWGQFESTASGGCWLSSLLIRRTEIVKGNDLGWFTLKTGHKWEQRRGPHYWQRCYNATFPLPKSRDRPEEFWLSSQHRGKQCRKNKASAKSDLKANRAQDELFEIRSSRRHSPQTCVILDRCRESRDYCLQRLKRH